MAIDTKRSPEELDPDEAPEGAEEQRTARGWAGWLISGAIHGLLLLIAMSIYWVVHKEVVDYPPVSARLPEPEKKPQRDPVQKPPSDVVVEIKVDNPVDAPITLVDVEDQVSESEELHEATQPKGNPNEISESEMSGQGLSMAIGANGGDAGLHGIPTGSGLRRLLRKSGAPDGVERTVNAALRWFKRHQSPNGSWDPVAYPRNCSDDPKCEPGVVQHGTPDGATVAMTGYALMCFTAAGYDHTVPSAFKTTVKRGLEYLLSVQHADGALGDRNYENAIASMALSEAYAMSGDPSLKSPAQKVIDVILQRQNHGGAADAHDPAYGNGLGWDYAGPSDRNDSSVSGWNIMALKEGLAAGLNVGNGLENAKRWLNLVWKKTNPDGDHIDPYHGESRFPYTYLTSSGAIDIAAAPGPGQPVASSHDLTCVGAVASVFLGHRSGDPQLESLVNYIDNHEMPTAYPCNTYYMYYNTMAVFMASPNPKTDPRWQKWNTHVLPMFMNAQRHDGCFDGSWDPQGTVFPGNEVGRVLSTAYCTLCMEVFYRHVRLIGGKWVYGDF